MSPFRYTHPGSLTVKMAIGDEVVVASDPKEEEEEEAELEDPQESLKGSCSETSECEKYKAVMDACTERVNIDKSEETCVEELFDFMHCVDHCVGKTLFSKLK